MVPALPVGIWLQILVSLQHPSFHLGHVPFLPMGISHLIALDLQPMSILDCPRSFACACYCQVIRHPVAISDACSTLQFFLTLCLWPKAGYGAELWYECKVTVIIY